MMHESLTGEPSPVEAAVDAMSNRIDEAMRQKIDIRDALVKEILDHYDAYEWTSQGFGIARVKIGGVGRIHVWDSRLRNQGVSDIHAHPWDLHSRIVSGELVNQRFTVCREASAPRRLQYVRSRIKTGEGGGLTGEVEDVILLPDTPEVYCAGDEYTQAADEVHRSLPQDGTVTLMLREQGEPLQETYVFWPRGFQWVTAEPQPIKRGDYRLGQAIAAALLRWAPRAT